MDYAEKLQRFHEYLEALEEERRKIQVFERELPLCLELVTQAIEACKREYMLMHGQSVQCSEQTTSSDGAGTTRRRPVVLEEFIPIKRANCSSSDHDCNGENGDGDDDVEHHSHKPNQSISKNINDKCNDEKERSDWLTSAQLWNQSSPDPSVKEVFKNNGGGGGGGNGKKEEKDSQTQRKQRRCWSPDLHRRFLHALQQLGGSHATPKQIRELMKVEGLTNDEVKSHLQKYRLHERRPSPTTHNNSNPHAPQFVLVGGIWVQPPEYAARGGKPAFTAAAANGIYTPVAKPLPTIPPHLQKQKSEKLQSEGRVSHIESGRRGCGARSNSSATSSSTHTTTNAHVF